MNWTHDSFEDYLTHPALSSHGIMKILKSPAHYKHEQTIERKPSAAQQFGTLVHMAILEPHKLDQLVIELDIDKRSTKNREQYQQWKDSLSPNAIVCPKEDYDSLFMIAGNVHKNSQLRNLLSNGVAEQSGYGTHDGIDFKLRPDYRRKSDGIIIDIKTTKDVDMYSFQQDVIRYKYDIQAQFYLDHASIIEDASYKTFVWLCIETERPFRCEIYAYSDEWSPKAKKKIEEAIKIYKDCKLNGDWSHKTQIRELKPPAWYLNSTE